MGHAMAKRCARRPESHDLLGIQGARAGQLHVRIWLQLPVQRFARQGPLPRRRGHPDRRGASRRHAAGWLAIVALFKWPGAIHEGHGEALAFVDERADDAQRDALLKIMTGQDTDPFATMFAVYASTIETMHEPVFASIDFEVDVEGRRGSFDRQLCRNDRRADPQQGERAQNRGRRSGCPTASNMKSPRSAAHRAARPAGRCKSKSPTNMHSSPTCIYRPTVSSAPDLTSRFLRHERAVVAGGIALLVALSWWFLLSRRMRGPAVRWPDGPAATRRAVAMWWLMMVAMMLPSAAPAILLYARVRQMRGRDRPSPIRGVPRRISRAVAAVLAGRGGGHAAIADRPIDGPPGIASQGRV